MGHPAEQQQPPAKARTPVSLPTSRRVVVGKIVRANRAVVHLPLGQVDPDLRIRIEHRRGLRFLQRRARAPAHDVLRGQSAGPFQGIRCTSNQTIVGGRERDESQCQHEKNPQDQPGPRWLRSRRFGCSDGNGGG